MVSISPRSAAQFRHVVPTLSWASMGVDSFSSSVRRGRKERPRTILWRVVKPIAEGSKDEANMVDRVDVEDGERTFPSILVHAMSFGVLKGSVNLRSHCFRQSLDSILK